MADAFQVLAEPRRREVLRLVSERERTAGEIAERFDVTRQAVSQHLDVLEAAGLVRTRREGRYKFHDLDTAPLRTITERWHLPSD